MIIRFFISFSSLQLFVSIHNYSRFALFDMYWWLLVSLDFLNNQYSFNQNNYRLPVFVVVMSVFSMTHTIYTSLIIQNPNWFNYFKSCFKKLREKINNTHYPIVQYLNFKNNIFLLSIDKSLKRHLSLIISNGHDFFSWRELVQNHVNYNKIVYLEYLKSKKMIIFKISFTEKLL